MGRPKGAWSDKAWRDALRVAVNRAHDGGGRKLQALADKLVESALTGDVRAMREIGDRLDGRPAQTVEATLHNGDLGQAHAEALWARMNERVAVAAPNDDANGVIN